MTNNEGKLNTIDLTIRPDSALPILIASFLNKVTNSNVRWQNKQILIWKPRKENTLQKDAAALAGVLAEETIGGWPMSSTMVLVFVIKGTDRMCGLQPLLLITILLGRFSPSFPSLPGTYITISCKHFPQYFFPHLF